MIMYFCTSSGRVFSTILFFAFFGAAKSDENFVNNDTDDWSPLLPSEFSSFVPLRQWGSLSISQTAVFVFYHPTLQQELDRIKTFLLQSSGPLLITQTLEFNISCSTDPNCRFDDCGTRQTMICKHDYCRLYGIKLDDRNDEWYCKIAIALSSNGMRNILLNFDQSPKYVARLSEATPPHELIIETEQTKPDVIQIDANFDVAMSRRNAFQIDALVGRAATPDPQIASQISSSCQDIPGQVAFSISKDLKVVGANARYFTNFNQIRTLYTAPEGKKLGTILCLSLSSSILWTESAGNGSWGIKKAKITLDMNVSINIAKSSRCWDKYRIISPSVSHYWPNFYKFNQSSIAFATDRGVWIADDEGTKCTQIYDVDWSNEQIRSLVVDWKYIYWVDKNGNLFQTLQNNHTFVRPITSAAKPSENRLFQIQRPDVFSFENVTRIAQYGPETTYPIPHECFEATLELQIDKEAKTALLKMQFFNEGLCARILRPPMIFKIIFDKKGCVADKETKCSHPFKSDIPLFEQYYMVDISGLPPNTSYEVMAMVAFGDITRRLLRWLPAPQQQRICEGMLNCYIATIKQQYTTPLAPTSSKKTIWIVVSVCSFLVVAISALLIVCLCLQRMKQKELMRKYESLEEGFIFASKDIYDVLDESKNPQILGKGFGNEPRSVVRLVRVKVGEVEELMAMKLLTHAADEEKRRRLGHEVLIHLALDHPNIVKAKGISFDSGREQFLMEYIEGGSLNKYLKKHDSTMSLAQLTDAMLQFARGLLYMHSNNIIHNDIAVDNSLVQTDEHQHIIVKICDFELAKSVVTSYELGHKQDKEDLEPSRMPIRVAYAAPEAMFREKVSKHSDCYSFGVFMWQCLYYADEEPWNHLETSNDIRNAVRNENQTLELPEATPTNLKNFIVSCWKLDELARPTIEEIVSALETIHLKYKEVNTKPWIRPRNPSIPALSITDEDYEFSIPDSPQAFEMQATINFSRPNTGALDYL